MSDDLRTDLQQSLGSAYLLERELTGGGMSRVFVVRDTQLERELVVKVLPADTAAGLSTERFRREIALAARLQHPHIVPLIGAGETVGGLPYFTMPFVEGESLHERLTRDGELSISDAVGILREVVRALGYAHERGIVHRDIKPDNVMLSGGSAMVTDFGVAKALTAAADADGVINPRTTLTRLGMSLGTPAYMSPEQGAADPNIDARADLYAVGCMAYEMLTGAPPFTGRNGPAVIAAQVATIPEPVQRRRPSVPAPLAALVMQCLEKRPADRPADAREMLRALDGIVATSAMNTTSQEIAAFGSRRRTYRRTAILVASVIVAAVIGAILERRLSPSEEPFPYRLEIPPGAVIPVGPAAISLDGKSVAFAGRDSTGDAGRLFLRRLDQLSALPIPGTKTPASPVFSPDGKWIAYVENRHRVMKVAVEGGSVVFLADVPDDGGLAWPTPGELVLGSGALELTSGLLRLRTAGGQLVPLTTVDTADKQLSHQWPVALADGKTVLFTIWYGDIAKSQLAATSLDDGRVTKLGIASSQALGVVDGQLLYTRSADGALMAVPFDTHARRTTGDARQVQDSLRAWRLGGTAAAFLSRSGALVYAHGSSANRLLWINLKGEIRPALDAVHELSGLRISPDGKRLALDLRTGLKRDLWIFDFASGTLTPLTDDGTTRNPVWSRDGKQILYVSTKTGRSSFWWKSADGSTPPVAAGRAPHNAWNIDLSPTGTRVIYNAIYDGSFNLETFNLDSAGSGRDFVRTPATESNARFSTDGKWVAYNSDESGRTEVYVRSYAEHSARVPISVSGGVKPVWSPDGNRIFYWSDRRMMMATVARDGGLHVVSRQALFEGDYAQDFDVSADGTSLLVIELPRSGLELVVVPNWARELRDRVR